MPCTDTIATCLPACLPNCLAVCLAAFPPACLPTCVPVRCLSRPRSPTMHTQIPALIPARSHAGVHAQVAAAAELIEWAASVAPWVSTDAFVSCMRDARGAILSITGAGDPTGRGHGFSFTNEGGQKRAFLGPKVCTREGVSFTKQEGRGAPFWGPRCCRSLSRVFMCIWARGRQLHQPGGQKRLWGQMCGAGGCRFPGAYSHETKHPLLRMLTRSPFFPSCTLHLPPPCLPPPSSLAALHFSLLLPFPLPHVYHAQGPKHASLTADVVLRLPPFPP
eukprot:365189-Chlamydomonas_euryale.AAC.5